MDRRIGRALALAGGAVLLVAGTALSWHVETDPGSVRPRTLLTGQDRGPKGDPLYRWIVRARVGPVPACRSLVRVPDEDWAQGTTFTVDGTGIAIGRGQSARIAPGDHVGRWSTSDEVERFTVPACAVLRARPARFVVRYRSHGDEVRLFRTLRPGCTWRSGWRWVDPGTIFWVQDRANGRRLLTGTAAPLGTYGRPQPVSPLGVTCA